MAVAGLQLAHDVTLERSKISQEEAEFGREVQASNSVLRLRSRCDISSDTISYTSRWPLANHESYVG